MPTAHRVFIIRAMFLKYFLRNVDVQVNSRFAIDLIREEPVIVCTQRVVASDSGGPLGHPRVYINLVILC